MFITTCQAENTFEITRRLAAYLDDKLKRPLSIVEDIPWEERYIRLDQGAIQMGWICSLPYTKRADEPNPRMELLAAPVMQGERYEGRPVYFSDVVVHADSPFQQVADLRGASWAFNEEGSVSGYIAPLTHLARLGETHRLFSKMVRSGAHMQSLEMVVNKAVDAAAIDSTVLDWVVEKRPYLTQHLRIIDSIGPNPIPPLIIQKSVPFELRQTIRHLCMTMHEDENGRSTLIGSQIRRFVHVKDQDYDPIRKMNQITIMATE